MPSGSEDDDDEGLSTTTRDSKSLKSAPDSGSASNDWSSEPQASTSRSLFRISLVFNLLQNLLVVEEILGRQF